jgi:hypothetical protein
MLLTCLASVPKLMILAFNNFSAIILKGLTVSNKRSRLISFSPVHYCINCTIVTVKVLIISRKYYDLGTREVIFLYKENKT